MRMTMSVVVVSVSMTVSMAATAFLELATNMVVTLARVENLHLDQVEDKAHDSNN